MAVPPTCTERDEYVPTPRGDLGRVAVDDRDVLEGNAQRVGGDLAVGRLVALAVREGPHLDRGFAFGIDLDVGEFGRAGARGDLYVDRDAHTEQVAIVAGASLGLLAPAVCVTGQGQHADQRGVVVAGVVHRTGRRRVGESILGDEVAPADLDGIEFELRGEHIEGPLDETRAPRVDQRRDTRSVARCSSRRQSPTTSRRGTA